MDWKLIREKKVNDYTLTVEYWQKDNDYSVQTTHKTWDDVKFDIFDTKEEANNHFEYLVAKIKLKGEL